MFTVYGICITKCPGCGEFIREDEHRCKQCKNADKLRQPSTLPFGPDTFIDPRILADARRSYHIKTR